MSDEQPTHVGYGLDLDHPHVLICVACDAQGIAPYTAVLRLRGDEPNAALLAAEHTRKHVKWAGTRTAVACALPDDHPVKHAVCNAVAGVYTANGIDMCTTEVRAEEWGRQFIRNVGLATPQAAHMPRNTLGGAPVFIVGAGPSLAHALPHLHAMRERGYIFAAANAAIALADAGVMPDAIFCAELHDQSKALQRIADHPLARHHKRLHVLAMVAGDVNWAVPADAKLGAFSHESSTSLYASDLNAYPMGFEGSVTCMAASVAVAWGASSIVLAGQDFGYPNGKMYGPGTVFADMQATPREDGALEFSGESKGPRNPFPYVKVTAWGGAGEIHTETSYKMFADWFGKLAKTRAVINTSEGGARVANSIELRMPDLLAGMIPLQSRADVAAIAQGLPRPVTRARNVLSSLIGEARHHRQLDRMFPMPSFPLLNMWCAAGAIRARKETLDPQRRVEIYRETYRRGCDEIEAEALAAEKLLGTT